MSPLPTFADLRGVGVSGMPMSANLLKIIAFFHLKKNVLHKQSAISILFLIITVQCALNTYFFL